MTPSRRGELRRRYGFGVSHLRHHLGIHEAVRLDSPRTGVDSAADQFEFLRGGEQRRFVLQPIAGTDFDHFTSTSSAFIRFYN